MEKEKRQVSDGVSLSTSSFAGPVASLSPSSFIDRANSQDIYLADFARDNILPEGSVNLVVTSPPYNVDIQYNSYGDGTDYNQYLWFTRLWLEETYAVLAEDGRLCLNIPLDKNRGGQQSVFADIVSIAKDVGFSYQSAIVWNEQNISRRTAWGSWLSASAPYVIAPVEMIALLYKRCWKRLSRGHSDITRDEFIAWTNGVWTFSGESKRRVGHPAPFPVDLPMRCMKLFSYTNDTVLDPFVGSGSTLVACHRTGRHGIGVDIDPDYCLLSEDRLIREGANVIRHRSPVVARHGG